jgi:hypothetical protein
MNGGLIRPPNWVRLWCLVELDRLLLGLRKGGRSEMDLDGNR